MRTPPRVVAFLQNQWFRDPEKARKIFERHPEQREELVARFLFSGCLTGRRIRRAFGPMVDEIVWEETSKNFGGYSASSFPADLDHMKSVIEKWRPKIVLGFGIIACAALNKLPPSLWDHLIAGPHPAARHDRVVKDLRSMASQLEHFFLR